MEIRINHLTKNYGHFRALDDVSFSIAGGMYGLLGPNGAGKTTLMRILATLMPASAGSIAVGGLEISKDPGWVRQRLGYIPQEFSFYRNLNAFEVLDYIAAMKNIPARQRKAQVEAVLSETNLLVDARRRVGTYSGGMKQRLGIAQALLGDPELIVVDEPTAGLDPEERIRFRNLLSRLSRSRTVLLSTHIVSDIEASCSGVAVLDHGRLIFNGLPAELGRLATGKVWEVVVNAEEWGRIEEQYPVISSRAMNGSMQVRMMADHNPLGRGVAVEPALEDGYMAVMKSVVQEVLHA
jgi:ABC-type multidrug transport system ATPase subunit